MGPNRSACPFNHMKNPNQFFGGEGSTIGAVHRLAPTSWARFVKETLGHPQLVNVTREQFHKLGKDERNAIKRVAYVTPATFKSDQCGRRYENAKDVALICLDIDDAAQAAPFVKNPELIQTALEPYAFAAYTTASSTPDNPKLRIMLPADHFPIKRYEATVRAIGALLGLPKVTTESKVSVQPMYLPTLFKGDNAETDHPLLIAVTEGEVVEALKESGKSSESSEDVSAGLEHLALPLDDLTVADARAALQCLDADCPMVEWIKAAFALRHQFGDQVGFKLWDEWSARGDKYDGPQATLKRWHSVKAGTKDRAPTTMRTVLHRAKDAGWAGTGRDFAQLQQWIMDKDRTQADLMAVALKRIAAITSDVERDALIAIVRDRLQGLGHKISRPVLKRAVRKLKPTPKEDARLPRWAQGICYVSGAHEFYHRATDRRFDPEVLDSLYGEHMMDGGNDSGRPPMRPRDYLLNVAKIPKVQHYRYDPCHPENTFVEDKGLQYVNIYLPTYPEPNPGEAKLAGDIFMKHMTHLIAEDDYRHTAIDFLACCVQRPGVKIRWAFLLQGAMGCGKTTLAQVMRAVLGLGNVSVMDAGLLFTPFNGWAMGSQLVCMEEIRIVGHNRYDVMNRLKPCISNDTVMINRKNRDLQEVPNITNYMMFTNHHDSLALSDGDRRYFVVNSALQNKHQVKALGPKYFARLFEVISENPGGLRAWFESWKISSSFDPNDTAPKTKYLTELTEAASSPLSSAVKELLEDSPHPLVRRDLLSTRVINSLLDGERGIPRFTYQQLAVTLRELDYVQLGRYRLEDARHYLWIPRTGTLTAETAEAEARKRATGAEAAALL